MNGHHHTAATMDGRAPLPHPNPTTSFWHSAPSPLLRGHRSTRTLPARADVVVVGSGMTGASAAWHLLRGERGRDAAEHVEDISGTAPAEREAETQPEVLMLEAREVCWGATGRNGGHCQPLLYNYPDDPDIGRFELLNHATLAHLAGTQPPPPNSKPYYPDPMPVPSGTTKTFPCEFVSQPGVRALYKDDAANELRAGLATLAAADPDLAAHCEYVTDPKRLRELRVPTAIAAVVTSVAGRMWPYKFVAGVVEDLLLDTDIGSRFNLQTHTPVTRIEQADDGGWDLVTDRGTVNARRVILATNGYTSHLLPGYTDLIVPCRGQMSALKPSPELQGAQRLATSFGFDNKGHGDYLVQRPSPGGGHLMFGGGGVHGSHLGNADDSIVDPRASVHLTHKLPVVLGLADRTPLEPERIWTGVMGYSRDERPLIGPVPGRQGLFLAAGFTGHGMPNTWLCGRAVAEMAAAHAAGKPEALAIAAARAATRLPASYLLSPERLRRARERPVVAEQELFCELRGGSKYRE